MIRGTVFSIEEFSTFDGPGIRTTVFLKGCPLICSWCHNPEGQSFKSQTVRSQNGCIGCGKCLDKGEELTGKRILVKESTTVCPKNLVRQCGIEYTPEELCQKLLKNADILSDSGGGITFSGGEPLASHEFLLECLTLLNGKIHRAVQTSGFGDPDKFKLIADQTDLFLFDQKIFDEATHIKYTGQSNKSIKENLIYLVENKKDIIIRIPLIPTVTDTEKNITEICRFLQDLGIFYAELLPYNKMAGGKYHLVEKKYEPEFDTEAEPQIRKEIFDSFGIKIKVM